MNDSPVIVLGAGLSGSLMALYLAKRGIKTIVYERRPDMRKVDTYAGKSINLALSVRGLFALNEVGMQDEILSICIPMSGRRVHPVSGETNFQSYSKDGLKAINSVSRGELNKRVMNRAEEAGAVIHFNQRCTGVNVDSGEVSLKDENSGETYTAKGQTIIACDGANSGLRSSLMYRPRFDFSQTYLTHAYKELSMPPNSAGSHKMEVNALHIWPRSHYMLIALPNLDGSYTCTLFLPYDGNPGFEHLQTRDAVATFFKKDFPDAMELIPDLVGQFFGNPTGDLVTIRSKPWAFGDKYALVGDAAHAIVPFYGQGMNAAFEDCTEINRLIGIHGNDWKKIFSEYEKNRLPNGNAIADLALDNFIEMRDKVGDPAWVFRKGVEHLLEKEFPENYVSRYELISFSRVPYAEAQQTGEINSGILDELITGISSPELFDRSLAKSLILQRLGNRVSAWKSAGLLEN